MPATTRARWYPLTPIPSLSRITAWKQFDGDKLRGHLEMLILATLERGEAHGLEILRRLEVGGCGLLRLKEGSLYPALYRLEEAGEIKAAWERSPTAAAAPGGEFIGYRQGHRKLASGRDEWQAFVVTLGGILGRRRDRSLTTSYYLWDDDILKFTDQARTILALAEHEARQINHEYIGTEHILLALVDENSGIAADVLQFAWRRGKQVRREVENLVQRGSTRSRSRCCRLPRGPSKRSSLPAKKRGTGRKSRLAWNICFGADARAGRRGGTGAAKSRAETERGRAGGTQIRILQMKIVERAVRPVRAGTPCKRKIREELLAHLTEIYDEELARLHDPAAAIDAAARRFGDPAELSRELEAALPFHERISHFVERWFAWRAPEIGGPLLAATGPSIVLLLAIVLGWSAQ